MADLEEAITLGRSDSLYNLALYLSDRYKKLASIADLDEAITLDRVAFGPSPDRSPISIVLTP